MSTFWVIEKLSVINNKEPAKYYTGDFDNNPEFEYRSTTNINDAAMWQNKAAADDIARHMFDGNLHYWEVHAHAFVDNDE